MQGSDREEIVRLTAEHSGQWGLMHTRRLLYLISQIGDGLAYDQEIVWAAAHLHDWGAYAPWAQTGVDHAVRSTQVAHEYLAEKGFPEDVISRVVECIATHHSGDRGRSIEAILLSDADALDFLGVVGVLRDFSKNPRDMRKAHRSIMERMQKVPGLICLDRAREIAARRLQVMRELLQEFEAETNGCY